MASQETPNYRLSRWAGTDRILVEEFNDNWDKIDTALKASADGATEALAALKNCGNCGIYYETYTGNGKLTMTRTFPGKPLIIFISPEDGGDHAQRLCHGHVPVRQRSVFPQADMDRECGDLESIGPAVRGGKLQRHPLSSGCFAGYLRKVKKFPRTFVRGNSILHQQRRLFVLTERTGRRQKPERCRPYRRR